MLGSARSARGARLVSTTQDEQKRAAAVAAVAAEVRDGMTLGLGTGSTARFVIEEVGRRVRKDGLRVRAVPTSLATAELATALGIEVVDLAGTPDVDLDGADEVDSRRRLIKGGGGAMTREKCVAVAARRLVIVVDASKIVARLQLPVPVEVLQFALPLVGRLLRERLAGCTPAVRILADRGGFVTDNGNPILDVSLPPGFDAERAAAVFQDTPGIVEHGLFLGMNPAVYVAGPDGVRVLA